MSNKIKILNILSSLDIGGVESVITNYLFNLSEEFLNDYKVDFIVHGSKVGLLEQKVLKYGNVFHITRKRKNIFKYNKDIKKIIKKGNYNIVHSHINHNSFVPLFYAKKYNVNNRLMHSHGQFKNQNLFQKIRRNILSYFSINYATELWTCEMEAAKALYGNNWHKKKNYIMYNAIEFKKYQFDPLKRKEIRSKLSLEGKIVLTYVSRLTEGKNHEFLFEIIELLPDNYILLFVGDGNSYQYLKSLANKRNLINRVFFTKAVEDVQNYLSASDLFLFPSLSEGLPMVAVESQINGLKIICSNFIPDSIVISENVHFLNLDVESWVELIQTYEDTRRNNELSLFKNSKNYDIMYQVKKYEEKMRKMR